MDIVSNFKEIISDLNEKRCDVIIKTLKYVPKFESEQLSEKRDHILKNYNQKIERYLRQSSMFKIQYTEEFLEFVKKDSEFHSVIIDLMQYKGLPFSIDINGQVFIRQGDALSFGVELRHVFNLDDGVMVNEDIFEILHAEYIKMNRRRLVKKLIKNTKK